MRACALFTVIVPPSHDSSSASAMTDVPSKTFRMSLLHCRFKQRASLIDRFHDLLIERADDQNSIALLILMRAADHIDPVTPDDDLVAARIVKLDKFQLTAGIRFIYRATDAAP